MHGRKWAYTVTAMPYILKDMTVNLTLPSLGSLIMIVSENVSKCPSKILVFRDTCQLYFQYCYVCWIYRCLLMLPETPRSSVITLVLNQSSHMVHRLHSSVCRRYTLCHRYPTRCVLIKCLTIRHKQLFSHIGWPMTLVYATISFPAWFRSYLSNRSSSSTCPLIFSSENWDTAGIIYYWAIFIIIPNFGVLVTSLLSQHSIQYHVHVNNIKMFTIHFDSGKPGDAACA